MALTALEYTITNIGEAKGGAVSIQLTVYIPCLPKWLVCPIVNMDVKINIL